MPQSRCVVLASGFDGDSLRDVVNAACRIAGQSLQYHCFSSSTLVEALSNELDAPPTAVDNVHAVRAAHEYVVVAVDPTQYGNLTAQS